MLVGLEREWAQKEVGVRTFAIASLTGTLASIVSPSIVPAALIGVFLLVVFLNVHSLLKDRSLEMTTSAALIVMPILGVLIGQGLLFPSAAAAIMMTMLLAWKLELARFADALHPEEIRGAVMLALLSIVIFPLLPNRSIDEFQLFNPHQVWVIGGGDRGHWFRELRAAATLQPPRTCTTRRCSADWSIARPPSRNCRPHCATAAKRCSAAAWRCCCSPASRCSCGTA